MGRAGLAETVDRKEPLPAGAPVRELRPSPGKPPAPRPGRAAGTAPAKDGATEPPDRDVAVVFDSDHFFRAFQTLLLSQQGFRVLAPEEPESFTIDYLAKVHPRLLVTEILLPGADGLELVRTLREHPTLQRSRVVVFSVLNAEDRALASGADRFVQKPLMRDSFLQVIAEVTGGSGDEPREAPG